MGSKIPIHENDGIDVQLRAVAILRVTESGDGGFGGHGLRRAQSAQSDGKRPSLVYRAADAFGVGAHERFARGRRALLDRREAHACNVQDGGAV